jgi:hypothetical protein
MSKIDKITWDVPLWTTWKGGKTGSLHCTPCDDSPVFYLMSFRKCNRAFTKREKSDSFIVAGGFTVYWIMNRGQSVKDIYDSYYLGLLEEYARPERIKPGSIKRDFNAEFYQEHIHKEAAWVRLSQSVLFRWFLPKQDGETIQEYIDDYFIYIKKHYGNMDYAEVWSRPLFATNP